MAETATPAPTAYRAPSRGPSTKEIGGAVLLLLIAAATMFGPHIRGGGFVFDDWAFASEYARLGKEEGVLSFARDLLEGSNVLMSAGGRPVGALYYSLTHAVFGTNTALHLALAVAFGIAMSVMLFVLLRTVGLDRVYALTVALLVLLFPAADTPRLWAAAAHSQLAVAVYLAGLLLALRGLDDSRSRAIPLHAGALVCYAISLLTYEIALGGVVLAVLLYRTRTEWRSALWRWIADLAVAGSVALYLNSRKGPSDLSVTDVMHHAHDLLSQAGRLVTYLGVADRVMRLPYVIIAGVLLLSAISARRLRHGDPIGKELRRWLVVVAGGAIAAGAGYWPFLFQGAGHAFYVPLAQGIGNRTNIAASSGLVLVITGLAVLAALLIVRGVSVLRPVRYPTRLASFVSLGALVALGTFWAREVVEHRNEWDSAATLSRRTVGTLQRLPAPEGGSTVYTFGVRGETAPLVFVFTVSWDLTGAVRLLWSDHSLRGIPSPSLERGFPLNTAGKWGIDCQEESVVPRGFFYSWGDASAYDKAVFVDVASETYQVIRNRSDCVRWAGRFSLLAIREGFGP